jgi:hypothetical protein
MLSLEKITWEKGKFTTDTFTKYKYLNVVSSSLSFREAIVLEAYHDLEKAKSDLGSVSKSFVDKYSNARWYKEEYPSYYATVDNPYYAEN